jgi:hypothetical protein
MFWREFMKNLLIRALVGGAIVATSAMLAAPAQAFTVIISPVIRSTGNTGASASLDFNFSQSGTDTLLNLGITNTTNGSLGLGATQATLVGVGFDLPTPTPAYSYDSLTSTFTQIYFNRSATLQPYGTFDIGIRSTGSGNFTGGNPQQGLISGQSTMVQFTFVNQTATSLETSFQTLFAGSTYSTPLIVGRFQQVNAGGGSDKVVGGLAPQSQAVPAPPAVLGMLTAAALGLSKRRKQQQLAQ